MSRKCIAAAALAAFAALAIVATASADNFSHDPVPNWIKPYQCLDDTNVGGLSQQTPKRVYDDPYEMQVKEESPDCFNDTAPVTVCVDGRTLKIWTEFADSNEVAEEVDAINAASDSEGNSFGHSASLGACGVAAPAEAIPQGPDRYIFCAVAGNTDVNGNPLAPGTSLNLEPDQVTGDDHYKGATIGFFVAGLGATCQLTPQQAALAAASTKKVNHVGGTGDYNQPEIYTFVG